MRRILVMSDSHGNNYNVQQAVKLAGKIDMAFHLGDIETSVSNIETATRVLTYIVKGNCDYNQELLERVIIDIGGGHRVFAAHGDKHALYAYGIDRLRYAALENNCDIVLFGHTHQPFFKQEDGITFINPGSVSRPRQEDGRQTCIVLEMDDDGKIDYRWKFLS